MLKGILTFFLRLFELIVAIAIFLAIGAAIGFLLWIPLHFPLGHRLGMADFTGFGMGVEAILIAVASTRHFKEKS